MSTPDRPAASEGLLKKGMAVLTAQFATADDADGVVSRGELVGDAVANFAAFLKGFQR